MKTILEVGYDDYHSWYVKTIKGGVIANGFSTKEEAEKRKESMENQERENVSPDH